MLIGLKLLATILPSMELEDEVIGSKAEPKDREGLEPGGIV